MRSAVKNIRNSVIWRTNDAFQGIYVNVFHVFLESSLLKHLGWWCFGPVACCNKATHNQKQWELRVIVVTIQSNLRVSMELLCLHLIVTSLLPMVELLHGLWQVFIAIESPLLNMILFEMELPLPEAHLFRFLVWQSSTVNISNFMLSFNSFDLPILVDMHVL